MRARPLQICMAVLALIPVATGALTMWGLADPLYTPYGLPQVPVLDSNLRFLGGIWLTLGLAMWAIVPCIVQQGAVYRLIWGAIFLGGVGRLLSLVFSGMPPVPFLGFTVLEIVGAPFFIWWQHQVAQDSATA